MDQEIREISLDRVIRVRKNGVDHESRWTEKPGIAKAGPENSAARRQGVYTKGISS